MTANPQKSFIADESQSSSAFVPSYYPSDSATSLEEEVILSLLGLPSDQMHKSSSGMNL